MDNVLKEHRYPTQAPLGWVYKRLFLPDKSSTRVVSLIPLADSHPGKPGSKSLHMLVGFAGDPPKIGMPPNECMLSAELLFS